MIYYPKLIQIILNLTEIEALPKYIRNKSSEIQNLFSAEIPALVREALHIETTFKKSGNRRNNTFPDQTAKLPKVYQIDQAH